MCEWIILPFTWYGDPWVDMPFFIGVYFHCHRPIVQCLYKQSQPECTWNVFSYGEIIRNVN